MIGQVLAEEKLFENGGRMDGRRSMGIVKAHLLSLTAEVSKHVEATIFMHSLAP